MESLMKHFAVEEWIDFVNHVARTIGREKMKEHLEQGCKRCSKIVSLLRRLRRGDGRPAEHIPPSDSRTSAPATLAVAAFDEADKLRQSGRGVLSMPDY